MISVHIQGILAYIEPLPYNMNILGDQTQHKKASNHHANLPLEMYSFTL